MRDYRYPRGADLQDRTEGFFKWQTLRRQHGLWPFAQSGGESPSAATASVNFAAQDYLGMASHPSVKQAAQAAIEAFGLHSAGSAAFLGDAAHTARLEEKIADFLDMPEAILFPTGWAAGYGVIKGLVRSTDHVVMDALAHACLQEGAAAATKNIYLFRHNRVDECRRWLEKIRAHDAENGIMVVTESLFAMDSDTPDIGALQDLCHEFSATLVVDVAHDLGALGQDGKGVIGDQGMLGKVDLVVGSFAKTFGSNGGFVACRDREVKEYLRFFSPPCTFSNALSPVQTAAVMQAFEIIESPEGQARRDTLMRNVLSLRNHLAEAGFEVYGAPSAIVGVKIGAEGLARLVSRRLPDAGLVASLMEFPAVPRNQARIRLQVTADHSEQDILGAVTALKAAHAAGREDFEGLTVDREPLRALA